MGAIHRNTTLQSYDRVCRRTANPHPRRRGYEPQDEYINLVSGNPEPRVDGKCSSSPQEIRSLIFFWLFHLRPSTLTRRKISPFPLP